MSVLKIHSCLKRVSWNCDESAMPQINKVLSEPDLGKREEMTREMMAELVENPPALMLFELVKFHGVSERIKDFKAGFGIIEYEKIDIVE